VWRGLLVQDEAKHYRAMHSAIWLYLYLLIHADRRTGTSFRLVRTMAHDMGVNPTTVRRWLATLTRHGYVTSERTGRALRLTVQRWKRIVPRREP
jgi:Mn-dependent DtxR family transcriptional regulator